MAWKSISDSTMVSSYVNYYELLK